MREFISFLTHITRKLLANSIVTQLKVFAAIKQSSFGVLSSLRRRFFHFERRQSEAIFKFCFIFMCDSTDSFSRCHEKLRKFHINYVIKCGSSVLFCCCCSPRKRWEEAIFSMRDLLNGKKKSKRNFVTGRKNSE